MRIPLLAMALTLTVLALAGCAHPRVCPPGSHLGPYGQRCVLN